MQVPTSSNEVEGQVSRIDQLSAQWSDAGVKDKPINGRSFVQSHRASAAEKITCGMFKSLLNPVDTKT